MNCIDINCDMGEIPDTITSGEQEAIMPYLTSVNVACGGHAGNEDTMRATIEQALQWKLAIGAHPGYPDPANFGRLPLTMSSEAIAQTVFEQVQVLSEIAGRQGAAVRHVKPHGALYNAAAADETIARAIVEGVSRFSTNLVLVGLAGSVMLQVFARAGFAVAAEAFADRRYERDGSLRARRHADALITEPEAAARQAVGIAEDAAVTAVDGSQVAVKAATICIHGDTADACGIAAAVASTLRSRGVELRAL